jgi:outer membrane protein OmpA-like peptidoglycan-associated protein
MVAGYADEHGGAPYNQRLSLRRAEAVADYLVSSGVKPALDVEGRGQLILDPSEYAGQMRLNIDKIENRSTLSMPERIRLTSKARRVDIYIVK